jgi:subtilisin family serine protease
VARRWPVLSACLALAAFVILGFGSVWAAAPEQIALITFQAAATRAAAEAAIAADGGRLLEELKPLPIYRVAVPQRAGDAVLSALRSDKGVRAAEYEGEQVTQLVPNDALYRAFQWNLRRIGMEQAWDLRPSAADVIVAVLDTGVDLGHPDLRPNLLLDQGYDFLDDVPQPAGRRIARDRGRGHHRCGRQQP